MLVNQKRVCHECLVGMGVGKGFTNRESRIKIWSVLSLGDDIAFHLTVIKTSNE